MPNYIDVEGNPPPQSPEVIQGVRVEEPENGQSEFHVYEVNQSPTQNPRTNNVPTFEL